MKYSEEYYESKAKTKALKERDEALDRIPTWERRIRNTQKYILTLKKNTKEYFLEEAELEKYEQYLKEDKGVLKKFVKKEAK